MTLTGNTLIDNSTADYIIGSDECGYGSWAGPLVVCAAIVSRNWPMAGLVTDSKDLTPKKRTELSKKILSSAVCSIVVVSSTEVDDKGVYPALLDAHRKAIKGVRAKHIKEGCVGTELVIVDGNLPIKGAISLPKADRLVPAVSAASIVGKVYHDLQMAKYAKEYPEYGFDKGQGYGTKKHKLALDKYGPCPIHRRSYQPVAAALALQEEGPSIDAMFDLEQE